MAWYNFGKGTVFSDFGDQNGYPEWALKGVSVGVFTYPDGTERIGWYQWINRKTWFVYDDGYMED